MFEWLKPKRLPKHRIVEYADGRHVVEELFHHECGVGYAERATFSSAEDALADVNMRKRRNTVVGVMDVA